MIFVYYKIVLEFFAFPPHPSTTVALSVRFHSKIFISLLYEYHAWIVFFEGGFLFNLLINLRRIAIGDLVSTYTAPLLEDQSQNGTFCVVYYTTMHDGTANNKGGY